MNRVSARETIDEIDTIRDLLLCTMDYITELLRERFEGSRRMLTRTPQEEEHLKRVVKKKNVGKLVSLLKVLYTSKSYV